MKRNIDPINRPKVGLGVYLFDNQGRLFMKFRQSANGKGSWSPTGGHLEFGETIEDCAIRETKEEIGIDIANVRIIGVTNDLFDGKHYVTVATTADIINGKPKIMEPHNDSKIGWFPFNNLPLPLFQPVENFLKTDFDCFCGSGKKFNICHRQGT